MRMLGEEEKRRANEWIKGLEVVRERREKRERERERERGREGRQARQEGRTARTSYEPPRKTYGCE